MLAKNEQNVLKYVHVKSIIKDMHPAFIVKFSTGKFRLEESKYSC
jgi:hypothetical protein